jgi:hypothetical protein
MPHKRIWECSYCTHNSMISPRHWNVQRHIRLVHGLIGQPIDHLTRLTRLQLPPRVGMNYWNGDFQRSSSPSYQPSRRLIERRAPSFFHNTNNNYEDYEYDRDKRFWENFDRMKVLKMLEVLKEIRDNSIQIVQQNILIISQLAKIINTGRY